MDALDRATLVELARYRGFPAVTITMPAHAAGAERGQDPIRFRKSLRRAEDALIEQGLRSGEVQKLLHDAWAFLGDSARWRNGSRGLALFVEPNSTRLLELDTPVAAQVAVGDRFYLRTVVPAAVQPLPFYLLAISGDSARFFEVDGGIKPIEFAEGTPTSFNEALKYDQFHEEAQMQGRSPAGGQRGEGRSVLRFHGQANRKDSRGEELHRYLGMVDRGITGIVDIDLERPLMLAGISSELDAYREVNRYPNLLDEQAVGPVDESDTEELYPRAIDAFAPYRERIAQHALEDLGNREGSGQASHDVKRVVPAALTGKVAALFADDSVGPFGKIESDTLETQVVAPAVERYLRESAPPEDGAMPTRDAWDLVDLAISETLLHGGDVFVFPGEHPPVHGVAAAMRY